jgi:hypothetical protein
VPTAIPTAHPVYLSATPSKAPTKVPTNQPTDNPTDNPTDKPSMASTQIEAKGGDGGSSEEGAEVVADEGTVQEGGSTMDTWTADGGDGATTDGGGWVGGHAVEDPFFEQIEEGQDDGGGANDGDSGGEGAEQVHAAAAQVVDSGESTSLIAAGTFGEVGEGGGDGEEDLAMRVVATVEQLSSSVDVNADGVVDEQDELDAMSQLATAVGKNDAAAMDDLMASLVGAPKVDAADAPSASLLMLEEGDQEHTSPDRGSAAIFVGLVATMVATVAFVGKLIAMRRQQARENPRRAWSEPILHAIAGTSLRPQHAMDIL